MQAIVKLALKAPFKLRIVQITRMHVEIVGVHRDGRILELDNQLHAFALGTCIEIQQRMLIQAELSKDAFEAGIGRRKHQPIMPHNVANACNVGVRPRLCGPLPCAYIKDFYNLLQLAIR